MNLPKLLTSLRLHEGLRLLPYTDSVGILTIGYGRNLTVGISKDEAEYLLFHDADAATAAAKRVLGPTWDLLNDARQNVLVELCFNMGEEGVRGFKHMLAALAAQQWEEAANHLKDSKWYGQVGVRGPALEQQLRSGEFA